MDPDTIPTELDPSLFVHGRELYLGFPPHPIATRSAAAYRECALERLRYLAFLTGQTFHVIDGIR